MLLLAAQHTLSWEAAGLLVTLAVVLGGIAARWGTRHATLEELRSWRKVASERLDSLATGQAAVAATVGAMDARLGRVEEHVTELAACAEVLQSFRGLDEKLATLGREVSALQAIEERRPPHVIDVPYRSER